MSDLLRVSDELALPLEIVTQKNAILATSGAGKSNAAVVLAEQLYDHGIPWVAVDPKGDWWGVRSSRDGSDAGGLEVPVFGGEHGDVPLDPTAGAQVANLIAEKRLTCVLDVSEFDTRQDMYRFLADFANTLLRRNREPLHVFAEEADDYLPQSGGEKGYGPKCLGAWQRLVKRGRFHGIGSTLISQRSAALNKSVLNMTDTLIAMRVTAPLDRKAIAEWIVALALVRVTERDDGYYIEWEDGSQTFSGPHKTRTIADRALLKIGPELVDSLPGLADGEAWVWSPHKLKLMQRVQFYRRRTFDSGETPEIGSSRPPARLADIDLDAIKTEMADAVQRVADNDPDLLRARIRELEGRVHTAELEAITQQARAAEAETQVAPERVEVPVLPEWLDAMLAHDVELADRAGDAIAAMVDTLTAMRNDVDRLRIARAGQIEDVDALRIQVGAVRPDGLSPADGAPAAPRSRDVDAVASTDGGRKVPSAPASDVPLGEGPRSMLAALARFPEGLTKKRLAALIGVSPKKSTIRGYLADLRKTGLINTGEPIELTAKGAQLARSLASPLPTGPELLAFWRSEFGDDNATRKAFEALLAAYPSKLDKQSLGERTGIDPGTSTIRGAMADLRAHGIVDGWVMSDDFMSAIR